MGALVSGLDAGKIYQTWPMMGSNYFPNDFNFKDLSSTLEFNNHSLVQLNDLDDLYKLAEDENNKDIKNEVFTNIKQLRTLAKKNEIKCFLSQEADSLDAYIEIHAGAGGTESQDWADMLRRM